MLRVFALAVLSLALMGATTNNKQPACANSPEQYAFFLRSIMAEDIYVVEFYLQTGCGFLKEGLPATIVERGPYWIKIEVEPKGHKPVTLYAGPGSVKE